MNKPCEKCKLRAVYDKNSKSLVGRFWRWHINYCPGWRLYYGSLDESERKKVKECYNFER